MRTLFATVVDGIEDNNGINDAKWSDTGDATDDAEMALTIECLDAIITSSGEQRDEIVSLFNERVWGTDFYTQDTPALV